MNRFSALNRAPSLGGVAIGKLIRPEFGKVGEDEMAARGMCNIEDPCAVLPTHCSNCLRPSMVDRPLTLKPVSRDPHSLARQYLYAAWCSECMLVRIR